jgi:hypothetical protein
VLADFSTYHEWNPLITSVAGAPNVGAELSVTLSPPDSDETTFRPTVLVYDEPRELRWVGKLWLPALFEGEQFFRCVEAEAGGTRFSHGVNLRGFLLKFCGERLKHVARGFVYMNQALKRRVERS